MYETTNISSRTFRYHSACPVSAECQVAVLSVLLLAGILLNVLFLKFAVDEHKKGKRKPSLLLIVNLAVADILGIILCLPLEVYRVALINFLGQDVPVAVCKAKHYSMFLFTNIKMLTMVMTAFERHEALTKFEGNRKLRYKNTIKWLSGIWSISILTTLINIIRGGASSRACFLNVYVTKNSGKSTGYFVKIILTGFTILVCVVSITWKLTTAALFIRNHRRKMIEMFSQTSITKNIRYTKVCVAIGVTYIVSWLAYGVFTFYFGYDRSNAIHCVIEWCRVIVYANFAFAPLLYMGMDKRVKETARKLFRRQSKVNHVLPFVEGIRTHNSYVLVGRGRPTLTELAPAGSFVQCLSYKVTKSNDEGKLASISGLAAAEGRQVTLQELQINQRA